ncbi:MAG: Type restriction enzyme EcoKI protein, partial [Verrucomicrobiota bacterium]
MARTAKNQSPTSSAQSSATIGFEAKLWLTADKLRNNMDAAEYKHVVLGLIFLKYISDTFEEHRAKLLAGQGDYAGANAEDPDEYKAENVFWVPADARWSHLQAAPSSPPSARPWTTPWSPSSATTRASKASSPRTTPAPASTNSASANSSTS